MNKPAHNTHTRWIVVALAIAMAVLLYLDRFAMNAVKPKMMQQLHFSKLDMEWITSVFFTAYALAQIPAGMLGDRWGGRRMLPLFVAVWSLALGLQAFAFRFEMFIALRILQGIGQAGAYSVTAGFLRNWIEPTRRGFANSAVSMGGRGGSLLNNLFTPWLALKIFPFMALAGIGMSDPEANWREVFVIYAIVGFVWAGVFWFWFRDTPEQHDGVSASELATIRLAQDATKPKVEPQLPLVSVLLNRNVWLFSFIMFFVNVGWIFLATSLNTYLYDVHHFNLVKAGVLSAIPTLCGMVGCVAGGFATDWFARRLGLRWGRVLPGIVSCGGAATMYVVALNLNRPEQIVMAFACVYFFSDFALGSLWSAVQDVGRGRGGAMFGTINMSGNLGAAAFTPVIGKMTEHGNWNAVFIASAASFCLALVLWFGVDPRIRLGDDKPK